MRSMGEHDVFIGMVELRDDPAAADRMREHLELMAPIAHREGLVSEVVAVVRGRYVVDVLRWRADDPGALDRAMADPDFRRLHDEMLEACVLPESRADFGGHVLFRTGDV
jgi:hypothetical protein